MRFAHRAEGDELAGPFPELSTTLGQRTPRGRGMGGERRRGGDVEGEVGQGLVDDHPGTGTLRGAQGAHSLLLGHEATGRIVEVRYQISQLGHDLTEGRFDDLDIPAGIGHRNRHRAEPGTAHGVQRVRIGGILDHDPVAGAAQQPQDQRECVLSAGGHQDLFGHGRQAPPGEPLGDGGAQLRKAVGVVAGGVRVRAQLRGDLGERLGERPFRQPGGGPGQVDRGVLGSEEPADAVRGTAFGKRRPGAGALPAVRVAALAQQVVHGGDGGPAGAQGGGQLPLGGQSDVQRDPPVQDQRADRLGQMTVGGPHARRVGQQGGELPAPQCAPGAVRPARGPERLRVSHTTPPELALLSGPITVQTRRR